MMAETKSFANYMVAGNRRSSPKSKSASSDNNTAGDNDTPEKPVEAVRVYSEKELIKELEKVAGMLTPEQDWSVRMTAMQRVEGLVFGGAAEYACFPSILKQLCGPLSVQLSDRRSSIVKQACHLLNLLSRELLSDFEPCAEAFVPVLFKLVIITVLVIAESADTCIKTMLRNCKVARLLPRIVENAKHDRNSVLRARCCEYALLLLEHWAESPEIQRSADVYEDLIKCCVGDAMSEVRSSARLCYRVFSKHWPDRARRLFSGFDPVIQRLINEEEGGIHKRYSSPSLRDRATSQVKHSNSLSTSTTGLQSAAAVHVPSFGTSPIVSMDRTSSLISGINATTSSLLTAQRKSAEEATERSLESVLQASQQSVNAIETMLKGLDISEKGNPISLTRSNGKNQAGGSYRKIHASATGSRVGVGLDLPTGHDSSVSEVPLTQPVARTNVPSFSVSYNKGVSGAGAMNSSTATTTAMQTPVSYEGTQDALFSGNSRESTSILASYSSRRGPNENTSFLEGSEGKSMKRSLQVERPVVDFSPKDILHKEHAMPGFQRPLLRTCGSARSSASSRSSIEDGQLPFGESLNYMDGLMSLNDALTEGLSVNADWSARVAAFNFLRRLLQQGPRGVQEVTQTFEKVMKLFSQHLDDPHHKVAQAALTTLADLIPICRKSFEGYLERILPHVFARLVDPKEFIRQLGGSVLEVVSNSYSIESLLPALLRSLDEQRSPKAKMAVIEFAISAFAKLALNGETAGGSNLLKLWLTKLAPLANEKNAKLKETAVTGILSVYSHFDATTVLNFIMGLSIEEQSSLRRALKQYTPRIEVDLMNFMQNKGQRTRSKSMSDQSEIPAIAFDDGYGISRASSSLLKNQFLGGYSSVSLNSDSGRKWNSSQPEGPQYGTKLSCQLTTEEMHKPKQHACNNDACLSDDSPEAAKRKGHRGGLEVSLDRRTSWLDPGLNRLDTALDSNDDYATENPLQTVSQPLVDNERASWIPEGRHSSEIVRENEHSLGKQNPAKSGRTLSSHNMHSSISSLLNQLSGGSDRQGMASKHEALQALTQISRENDESLWSQFHNQIVAALLKILEDSDSIVRELGFLTFNEILSNQKEKLGDAVEVLLEKLLRGTVDLVAKVSNAADRCLTTILMEYDPYRCLSVVVPFLVNEDEKILVTCISCLTKLIGRFPPEELMAQLPSFLPALFDAFGNQSADVRKTVVFCLVDIYIVLGKAFLPYLGSLSSTQLRLVTIYANRISQARSGTSLDSASQ